MKAVKKPVEIDYMIYERGSVEPLVVIPTNLPQIKEWIESFGDKVSDVLEIYPDKSIYVKTLEGSSYVIPDGYVIIRGIKGEYYPCEPDIFNQTYDKK